MSFGTLISNSVGRRRILTITCQATRASCPSRRADTVQVSLHASMRVGFVKRRIGRGRRTKHSSGQSADGDGTHRRNRQNRVHEQILRSIAAHVDEVMEHKLHEPLGL